MPGTPALMSDDATLEVIRESCATFPETSERLSQGH
jgi:hypothetical protein